MELILINCVFVYWEEENSTMVKNSKSERLRNKKCFFKKSLRLSSIDLSVLIIRLSFIVMFLAIIRQQLALTSLICNRNCFGFNNLLFDKVGKKLL